MENNYNQYCQNIFNFINTYTYMMKPHFIGYNPHNPWIKYYNIINSTNTFIR